MEPQFVTRPAFMVIGMQYVGKNPNNEIGQMWSRFNPRVSEIHSATCPPAYGICSWSVCFNGILTISCRLNSSRLPLVGGGLLIWAALRARSHLRLIIWGLGIAVGMLVVGMVFAVLTGLSSGKVGPGGWESALVLTFLVIYSLALVATGVGGILLLRDLFKPSQLSTQGL